jgi:hypothetical protein
MQYLTLSLFLSLSLSLSLSPGVWFSHNYGFGLVSAREAVAAAKARTFHSSLLSHSAFFKYYSNLSPLSRKAY